MGVSAPANPCRKRDGARTGFPPSRKHSQELFSTLSGARERNVERDKSRVDQIDISPSLVRGIAEAVLLPLGNEGQAPGSDGDRI